MRSWPNAKVLSRHSPVGAREKLRRTFITSTSRRSRESNPGPPEYEAGMLMNRMILTVNSDYFFKYFNLFVFLMHKHFVSCEVRTEIFYFSY
jgi:hypothetical protein